MSKFALQELPNSAVDFQSYRVWLENLECDYDSQPRVRIVILISSSNQGKNSGRSFWLKWSVNLSAFHGSDIHQAKRGILKNRSSTNCTEQAIMKARYSSNFINGVPKRQGLPLLMCDTKWAFLHKRWSTSCFVTLLLANTPKLSLLEVVCIIEEGLSTKAISLVRTTLTFSGLWIYEIHLDIWFTLSHINLLNVWRTIKILLIVFWPSCASIQSKARIYQELWNSRDKAAV